MVESTENQNLANGLQAAVAAKKKEAEETTVAIALALRKIMEEKDGTGNYLHEPTVKVLSELTKQTHPKKKQISDKTIYARSKSLEEGINPQQVLKGIKEKRFQEGLAKQKKKDARLRPTKEHLETVDVHIKDKQLLREQLKQQRDETARWAKRVEELESQIRTFEETTSNVAAHIKQKDKLFDEKNALLEEKRQWALERERLQAEIQRLTGLLQGQERPKGEVVNLDMVKGDQNGR